MCLILLALNSHPEYKLIIAANRDEFFERKTVEAHFWKDYPDIVGGRDMEAHGTWMAMTRSGKISMVTNYRDPSNIRADAPSRGKLVTDYLIEKHTAVEYLTALAPEAPAYNGFNLIIGNQDELFYLSNYDKSGIRKISSGVHALSNHLLDTPWPKVERSKEKLKTLLEEEMIHPEQIFTMLYDGQIAPDDKLPQTGIGLDRERALSSMFIKTPNYGSRCSTAVLVSKANDVIYAERVYDLKTYAFTEQTFRFHV